jgi:LysR family transcriptional regulator, nitrogen assimilation regulatory protein
VETRALRYFQAVAELASYSRAAEFLRISQPAVSRQISQLEAELGQALFIRHGHGVSLTEAGKLLLERSQSILRQLDQAQAEVRRGRVTLAVPPAAGHFLIPALTRRFAAAYPNVFLKIVAGYSAFIHEWLVRGQADLACVHDPLPQRGFVTVPLIREPVYLVGREDAFPKPVGHIRIQDLDRVQLILPSRPNASRRLLDGWVARHGIALDVRMEVDDPTLIRALLREGTFCSLLTLGSFQAESRLGELHALPFRPAAHWQLTLIQATSAQASPVVVALAAMIRETARDLHKRGAWPGLLPG